MSSNVYAKYIDVEDFTSKLLAVAQSSDPANGPECEAFFESEIWPHEETVNMGSGRQPLRLNDIRSRVQRRLLWRIHKRFEFFLSMLLPGLLFDNRKKRYDEEFAAVELPGWIVEVDELRQIKAASTFIEYLRANRIWLSFGIKDEEPYASYAGFLYYLEEWLKVVETAIEKDCGLLIYEL